MGCAKDDTGLDQSAPSKELTNNERFKKVVGVLKQGEDVNKGISARSDNPISLEETIWGVEAALNVFYTRRGVDADNLERQETIFSIPVNNDLVQPADVYAAYEAMWGGIVSHYDSYSGTDKAFLMADLKLEGVANNSATVKLTTVLGTVAETYPGDNWHFNGGDNWRPGGYYKGRCDGQYPEFGADDKLQNAINYWYKREHPLAVPAATPCQNGFINIEYEQGYAFDWYNPNWVVGQDPQKKYLLWAYIPEQGPIENVCIPFQNMRWYYNNLDVIISNLAPSNKKFVELELNAGYLTCTGCGDEGQFIYVIRYGEPVWVAGDCPLNPYEMATLDLAKDYLLQP